jgi:hypothetical protein
MTYLFEFGKIHDLRDEIDAFFRQADSELMVEMFLDILGARKPTSMLLLWMCIRSCIIDVRLVLCIIRDLACLCQICIIISTCLHVSMVVV